MDNWNNPKFGIPGAVYNVVMTKILQIDPKISESNYFAKFLNRYIRPSRELDVDVEVENPKKDTI